MFEPKKLYTVKEHYWLVYPTRELAVAGVATSTLTWVAYDKSYWSKKLDCEVSYIKPNSNFMVLEVDGLFVKILGDRLGWIIHPTLSQASFEEITNVST